MRLPTRQTSLCCDIGTGQSEVQALTRRLIMPLPFAMDSVLIFVVQQDMPLQADE